MDAVPDVPGSYDDALDQAFEEAAAQALGNHTIRSQAERLGFSDEDLREHLDEERPEILTTARDKLWTLRHLYQRRERLSERPGPHAVLRQRGRARGVPAALRAERLETTPEGRRIAESVRTTIEALEKALAEAMVPMLRAWLNRQRQQHEERHWNYLRHLDDEVDTSELRGQATPRSFIVTEELAALGRLLARTPGGSIGVAGSRGSGKSTAIDYVAQILASVKRQDNLFKVGVPAPVEYVPREFLVHLHDNICAQWLDRVGFPPSAGRSSLRTERLRRWWDAATIVIPALLAAAAVWLVADHTIANGLPRVASAVPLVLALATVAAAAALGTWTAGQLREAERYNIRGVSPFLYRPPVPDAPSSAATRKYLVTLAGTLAALIAIALVYASGPPWWMDAYRASGLALAVLSGAVLLARFTSGMPGTGPADASAGRYIQPLVLTCAAAAAARGLRAGQGFQDRNRNRRARQAR